MYAYLLFHNAIADRLGTDFAATRRLVVLHNQWIIARQFMPLLFGPAATSRAMRHLGRGLAVMPVEFSVAAYRFGHSMIRNAYSINPVISPNNKNARNTLFAGTGGAPGAAGRHGDADDPGG